MLCTSTEYFNDNGRPQAEFILAGGPNGDIPIMKSNKMGTESGDTTHSADHSTDCYCPGSPSNPDGRKMSTRISTKKAKTSW